MTRIEKALKQYSDSRFEALLTQWAREYGRGKADDLGYAHVNALQRLHDHAGWLPPPEPVRAPIRTEADKIDRIIRSFEKTEFWRHMQVLKIDYFYPNDAMQSRLDRLKKIGAAISRDAYGEYLDMAKEMVRVEWRK